MELCIASKEIIKPSSPTPFHRRTYKLSVLDQLFADDYFSFILFYSKTCKTTIETSTHLKRSLSNTLTFYYPMAGKHKDAYDFSVDCDDSGASFIEARIASEMSEVLRHPEIHLLEQLLPFKPHELLSTPLNLSVQVSYFGCGGMAIAICFNHAIADAATAGHFIKSWAAVACGDNDFKDVIADGSSIFPPQDLSGLFEYRIREKSPLKAESMTKRFTFDGTKIASLREKIENGTGLDRPTRFEVVSAIILGAVIAAVRESDPITAPTYLAAIVLVNVRQRMNPPLPPHCMGNFILNSTINWLMEKKLDYSSLVGELRQKIRMVDDQYARRHFGPGTEFMKFVNNGDHELFSKSRMFRISSLCKFPFYETDFGWGKPIWVCNGMRQNNLAILIDSSDGKEIEAWVGLPKEDMARFEKDPGVLQYATF